MAPTAIYELPSESCLSEHRGLSRKDKPIVHKQNLRWPYLAVFYVTRIDSSLANFLSFFFYLSIFWLATSVNVFFWNFSITNFSFLHRPNVWWKFHGEKFVHSRENVKQFCYCSREIGNCYWSSLFGCCYGQRIRLEETLSNLYWRWVTSVTVWDFDGYCTRDYWCATSARRKWNSMYGRARAGLRMGNLWRNEIDEMCMKEGSFGSFSR